MPYVPHTPEDVQAMLSAIGAGSVEELFDEIPPDLRPKSFDLPHGLSEMQVRRVMEDMAARNAADLVSFLGAGFYDHYIPAAVDAITGRGEFYTAYTPYQPEASQGTLQAIFEYQTAVSRLMGLECANASVYDGGTAIFEAMMMAVRAGRKRDRIVICESVNPIYRTMLASYTTNLDLELATVPAHGAEPDLEALAGAVDDDTACVVVANPTFMGSVIDYTRLFSAVHDKGALAVLAAYPLMQSVLKTPGDMGADIAVGEGQSLGLPLSFGGPYLGIMTCTRKLVRQMPGRIVGRTTDTEGRDGFVLTLQAREQHIRRHKATSNICSNQSLCALRAIVHMTLLGPEGMARTAKACIAKAHRAYDRLTALPGVEPLNRAPFANEFAVRLPVNAYEVIDRCTSQGYVPGFPLGRYHPGLENGLLVAVTEKHSEKDIGILAEIIADIIGDRA
jgi:glycine dehydrogenase subunit 1